MVRGSGRVCGAIDHAEAFSVKKQFYRKEDRRWVVPLAGVAVFLVATAAYTALQQTTTRPTRAAGHNPRSEYVAPLVRSAMIRRDSDKQYLWAMGPMDSKSKEAQWFDLTGSPLPLEKFEHGIGRDRIRSIDRPVFVKPDDPQLREFWANRGFKNIDDLPVIGYEHGGIARAYPRPLLDRHELVNDTIAGKPITVGW